MECVIIGKGSFWDWRRPLKQCLGSVGQAGKGFPSLLKLC